MTDVRRYLLGDLRDEEAERFEEELFVDDERFGELLEAEDDLIEHYLREDLDAADRARFESRFLATSRGRQKVALAAALQHPKKQKKRGAWGWAVAAAAVVAAVIIGMAAYRDVMQSRIRELQRENAALRNQLAVRPPAPLPIFAIVLSAGERGARPAATLMLPAAPATVETWLLLPPASHPSSYTATLQSVDGRTLWSAAALTPREISGRRAVVASIPSSALAPGTYVISLSADGTSVEDYALTVTR